MTHICDNNLTINGAGHATSHSLNLWWNIVSCLILRINFQRNFNRNSIIFIQENAFLKMSSKWRLFSLGFNVFSWVRFTWYWNALSKLNAMIAVSNVHKVLFGGVNSSPPGQNCPHVADDIFIFTVANETFCILIYISLNFVPKGPINNNPPLVRYWPGAE